MTPRARRRRFATALTAAVLLAGALAYTSFSASSEARQPSELAHAGPGRSYQLTGVVASGYRRIGDVLVFRVHDRGGGPSVAVRYRGSVPDPFRAGREVIVTVRREGAAFVGEPDSLITRCPSKFSARTPT